MAASPRRRQRGRAVGAAGSLVALTLVLAATQVDAGASPRAPQQVTPPSATPIIYYTVNSPAALKVVTYSAAGDQIRVGTPRVIANLPGADGLAFAPDGDLLVGGQKTGQVFKIHPQDGKVVAMPSGIATAYHMSVQPDGARAWTAGLPGQLASIPLRPFGPGARVALHGDDQNVTMIGFTPSGTFYTSSDSYGSGSFGTIDLATGTTKRYLSGQRGAHGFAYDPFTKDLLLFGSFSILQIDPAHPDAVVSERTLSNMAFDQGVADGNGHLLAASNTGDLIFLDYSASGQVGDTHASISRTFLDTNLDDIEVPRAASTAAATAKKSSSSKIVLLLIGVAVVAVLVLLLLRSGRRAEPEE